jgi:hypothetical protein
VNESAITAAREAGGTQALQVEELLWEQIADESSKTSTIILQMLSALKVIKVASTPEQGAFAAQHFAMQHNARFALIAHSFCRVQPRFFTCRRRWSHCAAPSSACRTLSKPPRFYRSAPSGPTLRHAHEHAPPHTPMRTHHLTCI